MFQITLILDSDDTFLKVIDKNYNYFFANQFNPNSTTEWFSGDLKTLKGSLDDLEFRNMTFDVRTDLRGVKKLLNFNPYSIKLYQFNKPLSGSLVIESLHEASKTNILKQNGLKHTYSLSYEFLTISSFDENFIKLIAENFKELLPPETI